VTWWEAEMANRLLNCTTAERSTWQEFSADERPRWSSTTM
jgi:hypothetical protein